MKHIFLLNPTAGNGRNIPVLVPQIRAAAARADIPYTLYESRSAGDIARLVDRCASSGGTYRFYACGGDGTLNEAVRGALGHDNVEIGCIPCGSGNDFVRNLGGTSRFLDIDAQLAGQAFPIDIIQSSTGHIAVNIVNIGFDCNVADGATRMKQLPLVDGTFSYLLSLVNEMRTPQYQRMAVSSDDDPIEVGLFLLCAIGNGGYCGGGFHALPNADVSDGLLDISTVRTMRRRDIIPILPLYHSGEYMSHPIASEYVKMRRCKSVSLRMPEPVRVGFDGEIIRTAALKLNIVPKAVRFVVP